ncbi:hypothetical protein [Streptomyces halobius]|uniref:Pyridoxamine 5'-phosphate oxidase n=1 Tax=Streptomyces halobius TaxID=2879846 RepID=A0ABY4M882_9ACTN|nr:hypothetical protein [Streptomyces halobius]UQA93908.1 hypothetical protein K9S39_20340 [Streptomyces halobius]
MAETSRRGGARGAREGTSGAAEGAHGARVGASGAPDDASVGAGGANGAAGAGDEARAGGTACPEGILRALAAHTTMTLAYADEDGPQACAVLYAAEVTAAEVTEGAAGAGAAASAGENAAEAVRQGGAVGAGPAVVGAGPALYFVSATTTRHGRALAEPGARVAFTAQKDGQEWSGLTGLQGRGGCRPLSGAERAAGWRVYTERFPFVEASEQLRAALERTTLWELRPDWLRLIDNGQGFGHKEEWRR